MSRKYYKKDNVLTMHQRIAHTAYEGEHLSLNEREAIPVGSNMPSATNPFITASTASTVSEIDDLSDAYSDGSSVFLGFDGGSDDGSNKNVVLGVGAFANATNQQNSVAIGYGAFPGANGNTVSIGASSMPYLVNGNNNTVVGYFAGSTIGDGNNWTKGSYCTLIGNWAKPEGNDQDNQIVIGALAVGNGSNTATIGDDNITNIYANENGDATIHVGKIQLKALNTAPTSAADTGTVGEIRYDADYMYVCVATDTWKRSALTTW